jgi:murein DD-endopeptidase MepM/ murein hydrolase activator NlpD
MHKLRPDLHSNVMIYSLLYTCLFICACASDAYSDIYRFVTVDGVETFTDAPMNKEARIIVKEKTNKKRKQENAQKSSKTQKTHDISLDDIVEKTVMTAINPQDVTVRAAIEPRLPPVGGMISSGVGMRIDPIDGKLRHHNGIDIAVSEGTPVRPATAGIVVFSGQRPGYGYTVLVEHDNGMITLYGHNSRLMATQGQPVDADTIIAFSGNTGRSTGPHLHFEAWQAGVNVTPAFMPGNTMQLPKIKMASNKRKSHFRKDILADGSILFTNVPDSVH